MPVPGDLVLYGTDGDDNLVGSGGSDIIFSGPGNDTLNGGAGSDRLYGGSGDDIYIWDPVSGSRDWLGDGGGNDTLHINALPSELTFSTTQNGNSLRIQHGHTAHLDLAYYFDISPDGAHIEKIVFADGTVWTRQQVEAALTGPLRPTENFAPEIIRLDGGRVMEGSDTVDPVVGWIRAHDENGDALTYTLVDDAGGRFYMQGHAIRVADWSLIDHETGPSHEVRVRVTDAAGAFTEQPYTITVLNREDEPSPLPPPPENQAPTVIFDGHPISELSLPGTDVGTFSITDPDGDEVFVELADSADGIFALDGSRIIVADPSRLNAETDHQIWVRVTDSRGALVLQRIVIDVTEAEDPPPPPENHAPNDLWLHSPDIPETASGGYVVGQIFGFDPDGDPLTYTIPTDENSPFIIQGDKIVLRDGVVLEGGSPIHFSLMASDGRGGVLIREFTINVVDMPENPPPPPPPENHAPTVIFDGHPISELSLPGTDVGTFSVTDPDGDEVFVELADSADGIFALNGNQVVVADPSRLNAETDHEIWVRVMDSRGALVLQRVVVDVIEAEDPPPPSENQAPAMIMLDGVSVQEHAQNGTHIGQLRAFDPDGDPLTFTLLDNAEGRFAIVDDELVVADGARLDHETAEHQIRVLVSDGRGGTREARFTIHVRDEPDQPPPDHPPIDVLLSSRLVGENAANGTEIGSFSVIDPDQGDAFSLELVGNADGRFALVDGRLVVADGSRLDFETQPVHTVVLRVTDASNQSIERSFEIQLVDIEEPPLPPPSPPENHAPTDLILSDSSVVENTENGTVVSLLIGKDADAGDSLTYTLLDDAGGRFAIVGDELVVADGTRLDHEAASSHHISVRVTDSRGASIIRDFSIQVEDDLEETVPGSERNDTIIGGIGDDILSGGAGNDVLTGGAGNDALDGGSGDDRLFGGSGKDVLTGGVGNDVLTGGSGKDVFVFDIKPSKRTNVDKITDFSVRDDTIHLAKATFKLAGPKGTLSEDAFWIGSASHDESDRIIYNARNGKLYYDADGTGSKAAVQIATLSKNLATMSHKDFLII